MTKPEGNNEFGKYEKEFSRLMQEAVEKHVEENEEPLNIDYSFLNDRENVKISPVKKRKTARSFARVAVILIVFFCGVSVAMVTDLPTNASAWKAQMARRLYVLKEGFVSSDPDVSVNYTDENTITAIVDDLDKIYKVQAIAPMLPAPQYVPREYEFDILTVDATYEGIYSAIYRFINSNKEKLTVSIYYDPNIDKSPINIDNVLETIESDDKTIYIWQDQITEKCNITAFEGYYKIDVVGNINTDDMILIVDELS